MEINGYRSLTDALNNTHNAALLGACNKMFWSEAHRDTTDLAIDILGMEGQSPHGHRTDRRRHRARCIAAAPTTRSRSCKAMFFFARSETIWGGTAEIQRNIVGERALGLPKEPKVAAG